ncbi:MAG TPA: DNA-directed RNA polymerase subunit alpha C-terminal domain-containing protein, partial [Polyangiaceae bacterium]
MSQQIWFSSGGERVRQTMEAAFAWCDQCCIVSAAPTADDRGDAFWAQAGRYELRVRAAIFSSLETVAPDVIAPLLAADRVRRFIEGADRQGHFIFFEHGDELRFLLAPAALRDSTLASPGVWLFWEGPRGAMPEGLQAIVDECWTASVPTDLSGPTIDRPVLAPQYSRQIPSVREVLGIRSRIDFFDLETDAQEGALWSALIGEGPVDLEQAIRLCADRLRAQGFLEYQRLHQDGRVYAAIEERLLAARRRTDLFDRPRNGFVRAIQPDIDQLAAEQWRDCLMGALDEGVRVDRDEAVRLGFDNALATYGLNAQRLRSGGRADQALRSAINSAIRQGFLARDGAVYLSRVAGSAPPTLRGAIEPESRPESGSEGAQREPDAVVPAPDSAVAPNVEAAPPIEVVPPMEAAPPVDAAPATESTPPPESAAPAPLDRALQSLPLPTRTLNWAARNEISSVRELVAWKPETFENEKNIGRGTIQETREVLESLLGCTWEAAYVALHGGTATGAAPSFDAPGSEDDAGTDSLTAGGATGWAQLAAHLTEAERDIALVDVQLPTRMKNYVQSVGIERLGDLFKLSHATLT